MGVRELCPCGTGFMSISGLGMLPVVGALPPSRHAEFISVSGLV
jgi:hypothetical protein